MSDTPEEPTLETILHQLNKPGTPWYPKSPLSIQQTQKLLAKASHEVSVSCEHLHPGDCFSEKLKEAGIISLKSYKIYMILHVLPFMLMRKDKFTKNGMKDLLKSILRAMAFIGSHALILKLAWCYVKRLHGSITPSNFKFYSMLAGCSIFLEAPDKWPEYALNFLPRYLQSIPIFLSKTGSLIEVPMILNVMFAIAIGGVTLVYNEQPEIMKIYYRLLVKVFIGDSDAK